MMRARTVCARSAAMAVVGVSMWATGGAAYAGLEGGPTTRVRVELTGVVTEVAGSVGVWGAPAVGAPILVRYTFDSDLPDLAPPAGNSFGLYGPVHMEVTVGGVTDATTEGALFILLAPGFPRTVQANAVSGFAGGEDVGATATLVLPSVESCVRTDALLHGPVVGGACATSATIELNVGEDVLVRGTINPASQTAAIVVEDPEDLNGDGEVNGIDLGFLLGAWGPVAP